MATHDVSPNITKPIPVGNVDIEIPVRSNGRAFGKVKISEGAIDWMPANKSKTAYYLDWAEFAKVMAEYGRRCSRRGRTIAVVGSWLRGALGSTFSNEQTAVTLEPLAGSQPGWRPRFESPEAAKSTWPVNELKGDFLLSVTEVGAPGDA